MKFYHFGVDSKQETTTTTQKVILLHPGELNIADGGEFLDDNLRMKEQPFDPTNNAQ